MSAVSRFAAEQAKRRVGSCQNTKGGKLPHPAQEDLPGRRADYQHRAPAEQQYQQKAGCRTQRPIQNRVPAPAEQLFHLPLKGRGEGPPGLAWIFFENEEGERLHFVCMLSDAYGNMSVTMEEGDRRKPVEVNGQKADLYLTEGPGRCSQQSAARSLPPQGRRANTARPLSARR